MIEDINKEFDINRKIDEEILEIVNNKKKKEEPAISMYSKILFATATIVLFFTAFLAYRNNVSGTIFGCTTLVLNWFSFKDSMR